MIRARSPRAALAAIALVTALLAGCIGRQAPVVGGPGYTEKGIASWYGPGFNGKRTANGEVYDMDRLTAAHKELPFDTEVEVRNRDNGKKVKVRINDRGPFVRGRIIDLSRAAARKIDMLGPGTARVELVVVLSAPGAATKSGSWLVQAGAFESEDRALGLARDLRPDFSEVKVRSEGSLHRVVLGPYKKHKKAAKVQARLDQRGIETFLVPAGG